LLGFPYKMSATAPRITRLPPALGQHGEEVLGSVLGYSQEHIHRLELEGILGGGLHGQAAPYGNRPGEQAPASPPSPDSA
jgi:hypothetical protein